MKDNGFRVVFQEVFQENQQATFYRFHCSTIAQLSTIPKMCFGAAIIFIHYHRNFLQFVLLRAFKLLAIQRTASRVTQISRANFLIETIEFRFTHFLIISRLFSIVAELTKLNQVFNSFGDSLLRRGSSTKLQLMIKLDNMEATQFKT